MLMPPIARYMTPQPWTIRHDALLAQAHELMREHGIRHLPVLDAGKLVGILSERDVYLFERLAARDADPTVEDAMTVDVYAVSADDALDAVVEMMAERKYGCVVVVDRRELVRGIFTTVDAMHALVELLHRSAA